MATLATAEIATPPQVEVVAMAAEGVATLVTVVATVAMLQIITAGLATLQVVVEQRTMVAMVGQ